MVTLVGWGVFRKYRLSMKEFIVNLALEQWFLWSVQEFHKKQFHLYWDQKPSHF